VNTANARAGAAELQRYIERISGARLPIVDDTAAPAGTLLLVGRSKLTDATSELKIPAGRTKGLNEEGFVIRTAAKPYKMPWSRPQALELDVSKVFAPDLTDAGIVLEATGKKKGMLADYIISGNLTRVQNRIRGQRAIIVNNLP